MNEEEKKSTCVGLNLTRHLKGNLSLMYLVVAMSVPLKVFVPAWVAPKPVGAAIKVVTTSASKLRVKLAFAKASSVKALSIIAASCSFSS